MINSEVTSFIGPFKAIASSVQVFPTDETISIVVPTLAFHDLLPQQLKVSWLSFGLDNIYCRSQRRRGAGGTFLATLVIHAVTPRKSTLEVVETSAGEKEGRGVFPNVE